jgi:hypothetical protein
MIVFKRSAGLTLMIVIALGVSGCESSSESGAGRSMEEMAAQVDAQKAAQQQQEQAQEEAQRKAQEAQQAAAGAADPAGVEQQRAVAGRAKVEPGGGYYRAIIGARRHVLNTVDRLAWLQAVQHFKAENGRLPKDHAEFMSRVVEPLEINLGYKEENQEFLYDPTEGEWGELYVVEKLEAGP